MKPPCRVRRRGKPLLGYPNDYKPVLSGVEVLKEFYKVPWLIAQEQIERRGSVQKEVLKWKAIEKYREEIGGLPRQEIVALFK